MDYLRIFALPCFLLFALFSNTVNAEKFVAKVKFTLVDPVAVSTVNKSESIEIPLKKNKVGTCKIDPKNGTLSGQTCNDTSSSSAQIELGGNSHQAVTVNLSPVDTNESITFTPQLFNGKDSESNFQLNKNNHAIFIGGQVNLSNTQASNHASQLYDVEVLYP